MHVVPSPTVPNTKCCCLVPSFACKSETIGYHGTTECGTNTIVLARHYFHKRHFQEMTALEKQSSCSSFNDCSPYWVYYGNVVPRCHRTSQSDAPITSHLSQSHQNRNCLPTLVDGTTRVTVLPMPAPAASGGSDGRPHRSLHLPAAHTSDRA